MPVDSGEGVVPHVEGAGRISAMLSDGRAAPPSACHCLEPGMETWVSDGPGVRLGNNVLGTKEKLPS